LISRKTARIIGEFFTSYFSSYSSRTRHSSINKDLLYDFFLIMITLLVCVIYPKN